MNIEIHFNAPGVLPKAEGLYLVRDHDDQWPECVYLDEADLGSTDFPPIARWSAIPLVLIPFNQANP